ncbi:MAG: squalene/phytoene synthase family protein [Bryobacteraceae bacterium]
MKGDGVGTGPVASFRRAGSWKNSPDNKCTGRLGNYHSRGEPHTAYLQQQFLLVTRFLPRAQRAEVEVTYAAVRYPDEIVDTFAAPAARKQELLDTWRRSRAASCACR